jgi:peptide/nickel transport system substrate-binding protein
MKRTAWQWLVAGSFLLAAMSPAETRPQYGGILHMATRIAPASLDPADSTEGDSLARRNLVRLVFDTLVSVDAQGKPQPALAVSWRAESENQRWQFWLRKNVKFHDGSPLTPEAVAASLRTGNPDWKILAATDSVIIQTNADDPDLPIELAMPRNSIAKKVPGGGWIGTGAFRIANWQQQKSATLTADENYWNGRAFVDAIVVEFGKSPHDQLIDFDLGKVQLAEVTTDQVHRLTAEGRRIVCSGPIELLALVFSHAPQSSDDVKLQEVIALSIDRASIRSGVFQDSGEPSGAILPNWVSGYGFVFSTNRELTKAQEERGEIQRAPTLTLGYDPDDALTRLVSERIVLNARDAGISLQTVPGGKADIRVTRVTLSTVNPRIALLAAARSLGLPAPKVTGTSPEEVYKAENELLRSKRIIPLFQIPLCNAVSPSLQNWKMGRDGSWHLADVSIGGTP